MAAPTFVAATRPTSDWGSTAQGATRTTGSFSVTAGDVLVVVAGAEDGRFSFTGTPSGGSLTWTQQELIGTSNASARAGLWTATATTTTSITVSVTADSAQAFARNWGFVVHQYRGSAGIGAHTSVLGSASTAPSLALTTTADNSAISILVADWAAIDGTTRTWRTINSITPTAGNGLETDYSRAAGLYTVYAGYWSDVGAAGSKTTGISAPSTQTPAIVAIEIKGSAGAAAASLLWSPLRSYNHMLIR